MIPPVTLSCPVTWTTSLVSCTLITALAGLFDIEVMVVVVVSSRTSITSPLAGASVKVSVVPLTE